MLHIQQLTMKWQHIQVSQPEHLTYDTKAYFRFQWWEKFFVENGNAPIGDSAPLSTTAIGAKKTIATNYPKSVNWRGYGNDKIAAAFTPSW